MVGEAGLGSIGLSKWGQPGPTSGLTLLLAWSLQGLRGALCTLASCAIGTEGLQARPIPVSIVQVVNALALYGLLT